MSMWTTIKSVCVTAVNKIEELDSRADAACVRAEAKILAQCGSEQESFDGSVMALDKRTKYLADSMRVAYEAANRIKAGVSTKKDITVIVDGVDVECIVCDDACNMLTGDSNIPNALVTGEQLIVKEGKVTRRRPIFINNALLDMGDEVVSAVIAHEQGHIHHKHSGGIKYMTSRLLGTSYGVGIEIEADNYAIERGHGDGLKRFIDTFNSMRSGHGVPVSKEMKARISNLAEKGVK